MKCYSAPVIFTTTKNIKDLCFSIFSLLILCLCWCKNQSPSPFPFYSLVLLFFLLFFLLLFSLSLFYPPLPFFSSSSSSFSLPLLFLFPSTPWLRVDYLKRKAEYLAQRNARKSGKKSDQPSESSTGDDDQDPVKVKSCVLLVSNVPSDLSFTVIKETMKHHGSVQYVEIDSEKKTATVRFSKENEAISVLKTASTSASKDSSPSPNATTEENAAAVVVATDTSNDNATTTTSTAGNGDEKSNAPPSVKIEEKEKTTDSLNGGQEGSEKENGQPQVSSVKVDVDEKDGDVKEGDIVINEKTYHAVVLTGEAEVDYWRALNEFRRNSIGNVNRNSHRTRKGRGFKRGGGGYKGNRGKCLFPFAQCHMLPWLLLLEFYPSLLTAFLLLLLPPLLIF